MYSGSFSALKAIYTNDGFTALYAGYRLKSKNKDCQVQYYVKCCMEQLDLVFTILYMQ